MEMAFCLIMSRKSHNEFTTCFDVPIGSRSNLLESSFQPQVWPKSVIPEVCSAEP